MVNLSPTPVFERVKRLEKDGYIKQYSAVLNNELLNKGFCVFCNIRLKKQRHAKIKELVEKYEIETQEDLAKRLIEAGFGVTQATVSRDIREMKLTKIPKKNGGFKYAILMESEHYLSDKYLRVLRDGFVSMETAQNILVVKTVAGMAMAVAAAIDAMKLNIVGSIAGDDTIMMVMKTSHGAEEVYKDIMATLEE